MVYFLKLFTTFVFSTLVSHLDLKKEDDAEKNVHRINYIQAPYGYPSDDYTETHLSCIAGIVEQYLKLTTADDIIIAPGRSTIHFINALKALGEINATFKRTLFMPAFSRGRLFLPEAHVRYKMEFDALTTEEKAGKEQIRKKIQEDIEKEVNLKSKKITKEQTQLIINHFENNPSFMFSFKENKVAYIKDYEMNTNDAKAYKEYLKDVVLINKELLKKCQGKIVITDTLVSGESVKAFIKILSEIMEESEDNLKDKIKIINVNFETFIDPYKLFPSLEIENILIDESNWVDFSYNHLSDQSFFFPPWSWTQKSIWTPPVTVQTKYMQNKLKSYMTDVSVYFSPKETTD